jgi:hypothetical protein
MPGDGLTHGPPATKKQAAVTTGLAGSTGIPCTMVLTAAPRSPWCTGLVSHHHLRARKPAELDTSVGVSGPHGLAVRESLFVHTGLARVEDLHVHRILPRRS